MILFYLLTYLLLTLILLFILIFLVNGIFNVIKGFLKPSAPYVPVPSESLEKLVDNILIKDDSVVYDLGSGDGVLLFSLFERYKKGKFVGIERDFFPYLISKFRSRKYPKNIIFKREDFYNADISSANIILVYLFPQVLDELLPKMEKELKKGTVVYSVDFRFSSKLPEREIPLGDNKTKRGQNLFVYRF
jgi:SAM-dependent methyltransferase